MHLSIALTSTILQQVYSKKYIRCKIFWYYLAYNKYFSYRRHHWHLDHSLLDHNWSSTWWFESKRKTANFFFNRYNINILRYIKEHSQLLTRFFSFFFFVCEKKSLYTSITRWFLRIKEEKYIRFAALYHFSRIKTSCIIQISHYYVY